ncbi:MAG TPA: gluconate 2-dehydrogenase subunit 3 family protein [Flavisolibacter sp.]|nr:gluconate 2-dehydrogenase subunit 3 family protein [Flavisolibacter sp.]
MDRRKSLKVIALGTVSGGMLLDACKQTDTKQKEGTGKPDASALNYDRSEEEKERHQKLISETFFTPHEMATIAVLCDIIIPADDVSGSATQAGVPDFIEFMAKDKPDFQTPLRGGLRWLDLQMTRLYGTGFKDSKPDQQIAMVDAIAYPVKAKPQMKQGVAFFNLMRNLTATGFFTSEIGIKDLGYKGNSPTQWNGVPDEVLKQYGLSYTDKELKECVKFS